MLLVVGIYSWTGAFAISSVKYNGVSMTQLATHAADGANGNIYLYGLLNPTTGSALPILITYAGSMQIFASSASYTGVSQSGLPDAVGTNSQTGTAITESLTTVANNCWMVMMSRTPSKTPVAGTGTFLRVSNAASADAATIFDSNGPETPPGVHSLNYTLGSATVYDAYASFAPVPDPDLVAVQNPLVAQLVIH